MARVLEGQLSAAGLRFAIIVSRFNSFITERLLGGAMDALTRSGAVDVIVLDSVAALVPNLKYAANADEVTDTLTKGSPTKELWLLAEAYLRRERPGHTLQPTELIHEAYLRPSAGTGSQ